MEESETVFEEKYGQNLENIDRYTFTFTMTGAGKNTFTFTMTRA